MGMTQTDFDIELMSPESLIPYVNNPKKHPEEQVDKIASSIKNYGFTQPVVIDSDNEIIIGHGRIQASKKLGLDKVPVIRREDLSKAEIKALRIADNKVDSTGFENDTLLTELKEIQDLDIGVEATGFDEEELQSLEDNFEVPDEDDWADQMESEGDTSEVDGSKQVTFVQDDDWMEKFLEELKNVYSDDKNEALRMWAEDTLIH
jgi:ParB-like chromosome segregation protein Spo0J